MADELPKEVSRGTMQLLGLDIEVVNLDDGRRIITAESMERLFAQARRCDSNLTDLLGNCVACGAANGQACLSPR